MTMVMLRFTRSGIKLTMTKIIDYQHDDLKTGKKYSTFCELYN